MVEDHAVAAADIGTAERIAAAVVVGRDCS